MSEKLIYLKTDDPEMKRVVAQLMEEKGALRAKLHAAEARAQEAESELGLAPNTTVQMQLHNRILELETEVARLRVTSDHNYEKGLEHHREAIRLTAENARLREAIQKHKERYAYCDTSQMMGDWELWDVLEVGK